MWHPICGITRLPIMHEEEVVVRSKPNETEWVPMGEEKPIKLDIDHQRHLISFSSPIFLAADIESITAEKHDEDGEVPNRYSMFVKRDVWDAVQVKMDVFFATDEEYEECSIEGEDRESIERAAESRKSPDLDWEWFWQYWKVALYCHPLIDISAPKHRHQFLGVRR